MRFVPGGQSWATCAVNGLFPVSAQEKPVSQTPPARRPGEPPCVELDGGRSPPAPGKQGRALPTRVNPHRVPHRPQFLKAVGIFILISRMVYRYWNL